jgi:hypothetical protein
MLVFFLLVLHSENCRWRSPRMQFICVPSRVPLTCTTSCIISENHCLCYVFCCLIEVDVSLILVTLTWLWVENLSIHFNSHMFFFLILISSYLKPHGQLFLHLCHVYAAPLLERGWVALGFPRSSYLKILIYFYRGIRICVPSLVWEPLLFTYYCLCWFVSFCPFFLYNH